METVDLDMEDVFGGSLEEEGELQMPADLPELDDDDGPMAAGNEEDQNEDENVLANIKNLSKGAAKRKVLKPQPKLDGDRLRSSRGLPALTKLFEDVKFKGKGHEASDLKLMMGRLEHWAHRLFPKMPFDDFIIRMERLGNKRDVKTCIKRIRLDMPLLEEDFVGGDPEENAEPLENEPKEMDAEAAFEEMLAQERELQSRREKIQDDEDEFDFFDGAPSATSTQSSQLPISNSPDSQKVKSNSQSSGIEDGVSDPQSRLGSHEIPSKQTLPTTPEATPIKCQATPTQQTGTPSTGSAMPATPVSCDQRQRMEANKLAALKKRAARMGVPVETLMTPSTPLSPAPSQQQTSQEEQGGASSEPHTNAPSLDEANL